VCLLVLAWQAHPRYRLIVAANRDEFHDRPAAALAKWVYHGANLPGTADALTTADSGAEILSGRDLQAGGTWLAVDRSRRFGVVTNYRDLQRPAPDAPSRGELIPRYLAQRDDPGAFLETLAPAAPRYAGFNLLLADTATLWSASNRASPFARPLPPGVYGLSNHLLDTPWPKLERARHAFRAWLDSAPAPAAEQLMAILADRTPATDHEPLPQNGLSREWERVLSSPFVVHPEYGTRCSTVLLLTPSGDLLLYERRFDPSGGVSGQTEVALKAGDWC